MTGWKYETLRSGSLFCCACSSRKPPAPSVRVCLHIRTRALRPLGCATRRVPCVIVRVDHSCEQGARWQLAARTAASREDWAARRRAPAGEPARASTLTRTRGGDTGAHLQVVSHTQSACLAVISTLITNVYAPSSAARTETRPPARQPTPRCAQAAPLHGKCCPHLLGLPPPRPIRLVFLVKAVK